MILLLGCTPVVEPADTHDSGRETAPIDSTDSAHTDTDTATESDTDSGDSSPVDTGDSAATLWRSALYPSDWTPSFTAEDGHFLHDFSYAGYHAGADPLPTLTDGALDVTTYGADATGSVDSTDPIQAAIDDAEEGGGIVSFPAGSYRVEGTLRVSASNVVLQGAGADATFVYFTQFTGLDYGAHLTFAGSIVEGADRPLSADVDARATTVSLDTTGLVVGDEVALGFTITDAFVDEHGMTGTWEEFNGSWKTFFRRTIVAMDATSVTVDVPIRYPMKVRDNASLRVVTGQLTEVGLEGMSLSNAANWDDAWTTNQVHLVLFSAVKDAWVSGVSSYESPSPTDGEGMHLVSSGIEVLDSRRVTIANTALANAAHRGDGGNGYLFEISRSNEVLTLDSSASGGRHNFIQNWDFGTSGCVWLRTTSEEGRSLLGDWDPVGYKSYSEFHHSLAMANLIDQSIASDGWQGVNRQTESSGAGQSATQNVWWNISGGGYLRSLQYGNGYIIGTDSMDVHVDPSESDWNDSGEGTEPEDWTEGLDAAGTLDPPSLYEDQLARRLPE